MPPLNLRRRCAIGFAAIVLVALISLLGIGMMARSAQVLSAVRSHLAQVERLSHQVGLVDRGARGAESVTHCGFAVVAGEARALAQRSAAAAREIKALIEGKTRSVDAGTSLVEQSAAASDSLKVQAAELREAIEAFRTGR